MADKHMHPFSRQAAGDAKVLKHFEVTTINKKSSAGTEGTLIRGQI